MRRTIAMLTDFGLDDTYVGVMKGVIRGIAPEVEIVDLSHSVPPQHVRSAGLSLLTAYSFFPAGTIFLVVVDPGVGSERRPVLVEADDYVFVAPDNGVLSYVLAECDVTRAVTLTDPAYHLPEVSATFHGRDVFSPAAAHVAHGVDAAELGEPIRNLASLPQPELSITGRRVSGEVIHLDRFGNIVTSIGTLEWGAADKIKLTPRFGDDTTTTLINADSAAVEIHDQTISTIRRSYSDAIRGETLALIGSTKFLEISVNQGSAAERLDVRIGDRVEMHLGEFNATVRD